MTTVLDASAILATLRGEAGADRVADAMASGAVVGAVNLSEVVAKVVERDASTEQVDAILVRFLSRTRPFDADQAASAGRLRAVTRPAGLSLGDRSCLALALALGAPVLTADRAWAGLDVGVSIEVIR